jgi:hypothetical protein
MKKLLAGAITALACYCGNANAFWIIFPTAPLDKLSDLITGSEGEHCVRETAKVGDSITSRAGQSATIVSLSGTSFRHCKNSQFPIRAKLEFNYAFSSKAGIDIPDEFEQKTLTNDQRFDGYILFAENSRENFGVTVSARPREYVADTLELLYGLAKNMESTLDGGTNGDPERTEIDGMPAWRIEVTGKRRGFFGQRYTYMYTAIEGDKEIVVINTYSLTDDYEKRKAGLRKISESVRGLKTTVAESGPQPAESQAEAATEAAPNKHE